MNFRSTAAAVVLVATVLAACPPAWAFHHPTVGRWMQRDPAGYVDGMGLYEYVRGRPPAGADPSGRFFWVTYGGYVPHGEPYYEHKGQRPVSAVHRVLPEVVREGCACECYNWVKKQYWKGEQVTYFFGRISITPHVTWTFAKVSGRTTGTWRGRPYSTNQPWAPTMVHYGCEGCPVPAGADAVLVPPP